MRRRAFLASSALLLGCGEAMPRGQLPSQFGGPSPWHMWGSHGQVIVPEPSSSATQFSQSKQLARINYKRPDTWHFLFAATLIAAPDGTPGNVDVIIDFDLIVGLGRTMVQLKGRPGEPGFARIVFHYTGVASAQVGVTKWMTQTEGEASNLIPATPVVYPITEFPAQDIQCSARVVTQSASAEVEPTIVEVHSYFAPKTHVRPDWFQDQPADQFRGVEQGGT